jgi:hypothetical protein
MVVNKRRRTNNKSGGAGGGRQSSFDVMKTGDGQFDDEEFIADASKTESILQEFAIFEEDLQKSSEDWIATLESNIQEPFDTADPVAVSERLVAIVTLCRSILDRYMAMHTGFLLDRKFMRKLKYLWAAEQDLARRIMRKFFKNTIDPFYSDFDRRLQAFVVVQQNSEFQIRLQTSIKSLLEKSKDGHRKLMAYYNNKLSPSSMLLTTTFGVIYTMKVIRIFVVAGALYLASQAFQAKYVSTVFVNNTDPPNLLFFMVMFFIIETAFMGLIMFILYLLKYVLGIDSSFPVTDQVFKDFMVDYCISSVVIFVLGLMLSHVVMKKKYFRYRTDGLRAIRSLQEMMLYVASVVLIFPFFIMDIA